MHLIRSTGLIVLGLFALSMMGCGGSSGSASVSSLSQLPDPASMVSTSTSSTGLSRAVVSGTAPLITDLHSNADQYFWNGILASKLTSANFSALSSSDKSLYASEFWGGDFAHDGPSGQGGCSMAQNTAQVFGRLLESSGSSCYMKNFPSAATGITITPTPAGGNENLFAQAASDFIVKVNVTNDSEDGNESKSNTTVYIRVFGTDTVGSDVYKVRLHFCNDGATQANGSESFEVNRSTLAFTSTSKHNETNGTFSSDVSAFLKAGSGTNLAFDPSKDRTITMKGSFGSDTFASKITITSDNLIYSLMNHATSFNSQSWNDKTSSVAQFSGDSANTVRFLAAGFNGYQSCVGCGVGDFSHEFKGAVEWHTSYYAAVDTAASDLYTKAVATNLTTDSFFSESKTPDADVSSLGCDLTADYTVSLDFADSAIAAVKTQCDGDHKVRGEDNNYCWGGSVQTAQQVVQTYYCNNGGCGP
jgi:hypothetical protein